MNASSLQAVGCLMGASAVLSGAFGAHALTKKGWSEKAQKNWQTAAHYQLVHSAMAVLSARVSSGPHWSGWLFTAGNLLFSGSIYYLTVHSERQARKDNEREKSKLGLLTPLGGLLYVAGWLAMAFGR